VRGPPPCRSRRFRDRGRGTPYGTLVLAVLACPGLSPAAPAESPLLGRIERVADGDTVTLATGQTRYRIRLHEIDAPEHDQPWSRQSRQALSSKVTGKYVRVEVETVDDYGRTVGRIWLGDRDINREMVHEGHAWVYRKYLKDQSLLADEGAAQEASRGLWSLADPVPPWQWRQAARAAADALREGGDQHCEIKGNINRRGDRIYHQPGDRHYRETRIDTSRGERWFCSPEAAEQAGWRSPR
jgi:endonuclease YncB( thermonuclease family)